MSQSVGPLKPEILTDAQVRSDSIAQALERLAWLMDHSIAIPGTKFRVGLDAILGLLPVGGDLICGLIQSGLVLTAVKHYRVPKAVAARMAANVMIDLAVGAIPFVGDAFDAVFKANTQNIKLLGEVRALQAKGQPVPSAPSAWYLIGLASALFAAVGLMVIGAAAVFIWIVRAITQGTPTGSGL